MTESIAIGVLCVAVGGILAQWLAWRFRLPAIVLLFAAGLLFGPGLQVLHPSRDFGPGLAPLVGLAVAIIVFEGGLALDVHELRAAGEGVLRLTVLALPISFALGSIAAHVIGRLAWPASVLFGAITVVTGPTVVLPLLRQTRLDRRAAAFLKWEAIVNDPVGAILAALVLVVLAGDSSSSSLIVSLRIVAGVIVAATLGVGSAALMRFAFVEDRIQERLKTPALIALALGVYAVANVVMDGAGLMGATIFGIALANMHITGLAELRRFKESLVLLLVSSLFIVLTADLDRAVLSRLSWPLLGLTAAMLLLVRPGAILLATLRTGLTRQERLLAAWIAPRGIVAAAVAGVAGLKLQSAGYVGGESVMPAVFALIAATMVLHGFSLRPLARSLGLTLGDAPGIAIVGASDWSTDLAAALLAAGVPTLLLDIYPGALEQGKARGVPTLQAEILSEYGTEELEGRAVDYVIAATPDDIYNGSVCAALAPELGRERVFQLTPHGKRIDRRHGLSRENRGNVLGAAGWSHIAFEQRFAEGWRFAVIAAEPGTAERLEQGGALILMAIRGYGALTVASVEHELALLSDSTERIVVFGPLAPAAVAGQRPVDTPVILYPSATIGSA